MFEVVKNEVWTFVQSVLSLYIVVNPSGVSSVFLGLTQSSEPGERRRIALTAAVTGAATLALFAIAGSQLFQVFHITGATLQIAGGIFVFGFAFALARGKEQEFFGITGEAYQAGAPKSVAFYPLASPLIAGPASITLVMTLSAKAESTKSWIVLLLAIGIVCLLCMFSMWRVLHLSERLGPALSLITPRLMGLILAVIAVRFILDGVEQILPRLAEVARSSDESPIDERGSQAQPEGAGPERPEPEKKGG